MKKYVIYTALVGNNYDNLIDLNCKSNEFDYYCFVRKGAKKCSHINGWAIEELDADIEDNGRLSRFPKILPHMTIISNYEYSLYIDANINILNSFIYDRIKSLSSESDIIALLQHPFRDCVYQESYVCIASLKGGWFDILHQIAFLKRNKFPKHNGLYEANVIFRKHNDPKVVLMDELWWKTFMKYSKRDQLSLVYALQETKLSVNYFLPPGQTTRNHPAFEKINHLTKKATKPEKFKKSIIKAFTGISRKLLKENNV